MEMALPLLPDGASVILNASIIASKGFSSTNVPSLNPAGQPFDPLKKLRPLKGVNSVGTAVTGRALNRCNAWAAIRLQIK
jgi:hypothetical protein